MATEKLVVLITGANQGIGYETAKALVFKKSPAGKPYYVLVGSRTLANGQQAAAELNALPERQGSAAVVQIDVTDEASAAAAAAQVEKDHGRLDVLVNNAGVMPHPPVHGGVLGALRYGLDVNVVGPVIATEAFLPLLLRDEVADPRIVFVGTSMATLTGASDRESRYYKTALGGSPSEYRATQAAVNMLMIEYHKRYGTRDTAEAGGHAGRGEEGAGVGCRSRSHGDEIYGSGGEGVGQSERIAGPGDRLQGARQLCCR